MDITPTLNSLTNFEFRTGDEMVLVFTFSDQFWTSITSCYVIGGIISTSSTKKADCIPESVTKVYIKYVAGFEEDPSLPTSSNKRVKFLFKGSSLVSSTYAAKSIQT